MYLSLSHPSSKKPLRWEIYSLDICPCFFRICWEIPRNPGAAGLFPWYLWRKRKWSVSTWYICMSVRAFLSITAATRWPVAPVKVHIKSVQPFRPKPVQHYHFGHMTAWRSCWDHMTTADLRAPEFGHCVWLAHNATGSTMSSDSVWSAVRCEKELSVHVSACVCVRVCVFFLCTVTQTNWTQEKNIS